jgi:YbbR domain-containing protein
MAYNPFRNFGLKAVAVGIATLLWVAVGGEKIVERSMKAPLEMQNWPPALELVGDTPSAIDVRVRGTSTSLGRLSPGDVKAVLDVGNVTPGRNLFQIGPDLVSAPFGVEVSYAGPATVALQFERQLTKEVPVKPDVEGDPAPGYEVRRVTVEPARVEVIGPESDLRELAEAVTEPVELKSSAGQVREKVAIAILNSESRLRVPQDAVVTVDIQPVRTERLISDVPVRMQQLQAGLQAQSSPSSVAVTVRADEETLKSLGAGSMEASVDLAGLGAGRYTLPVRVSPSRLFGVVRADPPQVQITIR